MDVVTLIQKVRAAIAASQAGNYMLALSLVFEIVIALGGAITPAPMMESAFTDKSTIEAKLEECCVTYSLPPGVSAVMAATNRPFIDALLPLLSSLALSLLKKWLGI